MPANGRVGLPPAPKALSTDASLHTAEAAVRASAPRASAAPSHTDASSGGYDFHRAAAYKATPAYRKGCCQRVPRSTEGAAEGDCFGRVPSEVLVPGSASRQDFCWIASEK
jgi:hypothetical protein